MNQLRMAVVGVGSLGQHHAAKLANFSDVDLAAVVDPCEKTGRAVAERVGTRWVKRVEDLAGRLDGVVIASPTRFHLEAARYFLQSGVAALVEKPLADNVADAATLVRTALAGAAILQVGHIERFNPAFSIVQQHCQQPLYIRCQRVSPYSFRSTDIGAVHDLMIHDIDLVLALTGEVPQSVDAFGAVGIGPCEDMVVARLKMPSGTVVDLTASRMSPSAQRTLQVWDTSGCLHADLHSRIVQHWQPAEQFRDNPGLVHTIAATTADPRTLKDSVFGEWLPCETIQADSADAMSLELLDFIAAIRHGKSPQVTGHDAIQALQVAEDVLSSLNLWSYQTGTRSQPVTDKRRAA